MLAAVEAACREEFALHGLSPRHIRPGRWWWSADRTRRRSGMNARRQRARPGQPREPHDRPRAAAGGPQRRRRHARGEEDRARTASPARSASAFAERAGRTRRGEAWRRTAACRARRDRRDAVRGRGAAADRRPARARARGAVRVAGLGARVGRHAASSGWPSTRCWCVGPEHGRVFREAGWDRARVQAKPPRAHAPARPATSCAARAARPRASTRSASTDPEMPVAKFAGRGPHPARLRGRRRRPVLDGLRRLGAGRDGLGAA